MTVWGIQGKENSNANFLEQDGSNIPKGDRNKYLKRS